MEIGYVVILVIVGFFVGYLLSPIDRRFTTSLRKKNEVTPPVPAPNETSQPGEPPVLRMFIDKELKWQLELDGERLGAPETLKPEQRQRAINVVMQMRPWLDGKPAPAAPVVTSAPQQAAVTPVRAPTVVQPSANVDAPQISGTGASSSPKTKDLKTAAVKKPTSIVAMIDEVLQAKLPGTPYRDKNIRLEDGPLGEVMVYVGALGYRGIEAVPDPEIRNLIRAAVAEWEKK